MHVASTTAESLLSVNLLDTGRKEIVYNYPAYVAGLDPAGTTSEDIDCSLTNCRVSLKF